LEKTQLSAIRGHKNALTVLLLLLMIICVTLHSINESNISANQQSMRLMPVDIDTVHCQKERNCSPIANLGLSIALTVSALFGVLFVYQGLQPASISRLLHYATSTHKLCVYLWNYPRGHTLLCRWII